MIRKLSLIVALSVLGFAPAALACGPNAKACHDAGACSTACETGAKDAKAAAADAKVVAAHKNHACFRDAALSIQGMECQNCADKVTKGLKGVAGVHAVAVDLEHGVAHVDYCSKQVKAIDVLIGAVKKAGYVAKVAEAPAAHDHHEGAPAEAPAKI